MSETIERAIYGDHMTPGLLARLEVLEAELRHLVSAQRDINTRIQELEASIRQTMLRMTVALVGVTGAFVLQIMMMLLNKL